MQQFAEKQALSITMKAVQKVKIRYGNSFSKISEAQNNVHLTNNK